eukprot:GHVU01221702.1.p1 GENE.GHVU01221702.1~~GHVU01221702.1.p1  ORF type:complete len:421 (+),score=48.58 GHVU01221702.1:51-1265(+)
MVLAVAAMHRLRFLSIIAAHISRRRAIERERLSFYKRAAKLIEEGEFTTYYRMCPSAFERLCQLLAPSLQVDEKQSMRRTGVPPVSIPAQVEMAITWLGGGKYGQTRLLAGASRTYFYDCVRKVMTAICEVPGVGEITFPSDRAGINAIAAGFAGKSTSNIIQTCVGAADGCLIEIATPAATQVANVQAFFSGHKKKYGVNLLALCDSRCRFIAASAKSPGGMHDSASFQRWYFQQDLANLPDGYFIIGDAAFPLGEKVMVPFTGRHIPVEEDTYNYCTSQLRIRSEMTFGLMLNKWQIFDRKLRLHMEMLILVIRTCLHLHNFVIDQQLQQARGDADELEEWLGAQSAPRDVPQTATTTPTTTDEETEAPVDKRSADRARGEALRSALVDAIWAAGVRRGDTR